MLFTGSILGFSSTFTEFSSFFDFLSQLSKYKVLAISATRCQLLQRQW